MLGVDTFNVLITLFTLLIYGCISIISLIFTFDLETYCAIDEVLNLRYFSNKPLNALEQNINIVDNWLKDNNKIVGPFLMLISLIDIRLLFNLFLNI
ncbi:hypothetical protein HZC30_06685 [Candidatus Woesearchaeota archaeon]|nr:hypothetical protein [Candidatus Woesearchaeota archaeon]